MAQEWLKMRFANERGCIARLTEQLPYRLMMFWKSRAQRPCAMRRGHHAGYDRGPGGRTGRVGAISAVKYRSSLRQAVQIRRLDFRILQSQGEPVLLVRGDKKNVGLTSIHTPCFTTLLSANSRHKKNRYPNGSRF